MKSTTYDGHVVVERIPIKDLPEKHQSPSTSLTYKPEREETRREKKS